jgi:hypothetical protein
MVALLKLHRFADSVKFQLRRSSLYRPQIRRLFELARRLRLVTLPLVWQPFPLEALPEAARATVPTGKAMH